MDVSTGFVRTELISLHMGRGIQYQLHGFPFAVIASRDGVAIQGKTPFLPGNALAILQDVLYRAARHAVHFASTPLGEAQTYLTEAQVMMPPDIEIRDNTVVGHGELTASRQFNGPVLIKG